MSMKTASDPRRVYSRNGTVHTLFAGLTFVPMGPTRATTDTAVRIEGAPNSAGGRKRVTVKFRQGGETVTETWRQGTVPTNPRG